MTQQQVLTIDELNVLDAEAFTASLADIFEHSPWIPAAASPMRPFVDVASLHAALCSVLRDALDDAKLALIRAHPRLAGKAAIRGELTDASTREQKGAGLSHCSAEEFRLLNEFNDAYDQRFGFPFILAVRGHTPSSIIDNMQRRINNDREHEFAEALRQIEAIAMARLSDKLQH